jgi:membrane protease YdiL (CAAX protease family)
MNKILRFFDLHQGEDRKEAVLENVVSNISFRGANAWILACAIVVASVGLNVNSTAVIIGAMLISPLMGPIVGAGFALGTFDFPLLKKSLKNLLIATLISLVVSFIYFLLSPFKEAQSELLARTSPNIYDVMIAYLVENPYKFNPEYTLGDFFRSLYYVSKAIIFEELIFRGALLYMLVSRFGKTKAAFITAIAFGVYHWFSYGVIGHVFEMSRVLMSTGVFGYLLARICIKTGKIIFPLAM